MARPPKPERKPPGFIASILIRISKTILWMVGALIISIIIEWGGMAFDWWEQGEEHSRWMLENEASYIGDEFKENVMGLEPVTFAVAVADFTYKWMFEATRIQDAVRYLDSPVWMMQDTYVASVVRGIQTVLHYVEAAMNVTQVFSLRIAVLILSVQMFIFFGLIGFVDGWVLRDKRRWGLGDESSFLYHPSKRMVGVIIGLSWITYLSLPTSVHPNLIIVPFAVLFGFIVRTTASKFKKYW